MLQSLYNQYKMNFDDQLIASNNTRSRMFSMLRLFILFLKTEDKNSS